MQVSHMCGRHLDLGRFSAFSGQQQVAGLEVQQPEHELVPALDAGIGGAALSSMPH